MTRGDRSVKLAGMQVDHAARHHHDRLAREPKRMAHGLARLGLRLARDGAGVDDDDVGLVRIHQRKAGAHEVGGDAVGSTRLTRQPRLTTHAKGRVIWLPSESRISSMASRMRSPMVRCFLSRRALARGLGKALERLASVVGELGGNVDHNAGDEPATAAGAQAGHAVAAQPRGPRRTACPRGPRARNARRAGCPRRRPCSRGRPRRCRYGPRSAGRPVPVALEALVGLDLDGHDEVAGTSAAEARLAVAAQTQLAAGAHARRGTSTSRRSWMRTRPSPWQCEQGLSMTVPSPLQSGHGELDCMAPKTGLLDRGHVARAVAVRAGRSWPPASPPEPLQSCTGRGGRRDGSCSPEPASSRVMESEMAISRPARRRARSGGRDRAFRGRRSRRRSRRRCHRRPCRRRCRRNQRSRSRRACHRRCRSGRTWSASARRTGPSRPRSARRTARSHRAHRYDRDEA